MRRNPTVDRSVPVGQRPGTGAADNARGRGEPQQPVVGGPTGAVRRDSLPPRSETSVIGSFDPRGRHASERERGRYYWHDYQGRRYSHYVDMYGDDHYYWYHGSGYYSMRYYDGRWWRYDGRYGRNCYLHNGYWYYEHGGRNYVYDDDSDSYQDSEPIVAPSGVSVTLSVGTFGPAKGGPNDVLTNNAGFLTFDQKELDNFFIGGEVSKGLGNNVEVGVDAGYYKGTLGSNYTDYVHPDGTEIQQQISLSAVPVTATAKYFPLGRDKKLQPYVGAGVGATKWNYQEKGEFIDFANAGLPFYNETYKASGVAVSPVLIAGLRAPINNRVSIGGEYRRSWAQGALAPEQGFAGDKVNLGGNSLRANVTVNLGK